MQHTARLSTKKNHKREGEAARSLKRGTRRGTHGPVSGRILPELAMWPGGGLSGWISES